MKIVLTTAAFFATQLFTFAGPSSAGSAPISTPSATSPWEFRIQAYGWLTGIDGTTGPENITTDLSAGFDDVFEVLEMAAALQFEARNGRWGVLADAFYAELGTSGTLPDEFQTGIDVDFKQFLGELVVLYRVSESSESWTDLYAGIRYNSISLDLEATSSGATVVKGDRRSADKGWVDPIIGARTHWDLNEKWYLAAKGDIGGFGVESDFTWNVHASVGYKFNEATSLEVGYRYFGTDFTDGRYVYDIDQSGALIGLNFKF